MKIALAINYDYPDYGGMLQAFATQRVLDKQGITSEAICFDRLKGEINRRKWHYFLSNITDISIVKEKSKLIEKRLYQKFNHRLKSKLSERNIAFESWCKANFKVSRPFESWTDLTESSRLYDAVLVGSDQLWLPSNVIADYYTLNWVPDEVNKVSYATSFGIGQIPTKYEYVYRNYLTRINHLSAREVSGQSIINQLTGRKVPQVCDPALLLDREGWEEVVSPRIIDEKYIFCYFMGDNPEQRNYVMRIAKKTGYKIVALLHLDQLVSSDENYVDFAPYNISPSDFVSLVKHAELVCTDSFHGTVFSINYSRPFLTFMRFKQTATLSTNTRITSLLSTLGLEERLMNEEKMKILEIPSVNWTKVQQRVTEIRCSSMDYLMSALKK